jgi:threonine dehydratase
MVAPPVGPTPAESEAALARLAGRIERTPARPWVPDTGVVDPPRGADLHLKLELFQRTGTFKARGALTNILAADPQALERGVTAVSAGNHAIAVAYAARVAGTTARVVVLESANPGRIARCRSYGAEIERAPDGASGFARAQEIAREEGRLFVHPFEGENTILGTSTVGVEILQQVPDAEAIVVPCGGGGLLAGIAAAVKARRPECRVYGVEPEGADSMRRSLDAGEPVAIDRVDTIADSLGAPHAAPYGFSIIRERVDDVVLVGDADLRRAMRALFEDAKIVAEPASAAPLAAACGPLRERLEGRRVVLVVSGSNIDIETFSRLVAGG